MCKLAIWGKLIEQFYFFNGYYNFQNMYSDNEIQIPDTIFEMDVDEDTRYFKNIYKCRYYIFYEQ